MVQDDVSLVCAAGAGVSSKHSSVVWVRKSCGHLDNVGTGKCNVFCSVPGPLRTVQRAEMWGRSMGGVDEHRPFPLIKDGDLLLITKDMLILKGLHSITDVKGHADDEIVRLRVVGQIDKDGDGDADKAAELDRRHVGANVIDGRVFSQAFHISL